MVWAVLGRVQGKLESVEEEQQRSLKEFNTKVLRAVPRHPSPGAASALIACDGGHTMEARAPCPVTSAALTSTAHECLQADEIALKHAVRGWQTLAEWDTEQVSQLEQALDAMVSTRTGELKAVLDKNRRKQAALDEAVQKATVEATNAEMEVKVRGAGVAGCGVREYRARGRWNAYHPLLDVASAYAHDVCVQSVRAEMLAVDQEIATTSQRLRALPSTREARAQLKVRRKRQPAHHHPCSCVHHPLLTLRGACVRMLGVAGGAVASRQELEVRKREKEGELSTLQSSGKREQLQEQVRAVDGQIRDTRAEQSKLREMTAVRGCAATYHALAPTLRHAPRSRD